MDDYISREALKTKIRAAFPSLEDRCRINEIVNSLPAADVQPVRWIPVEERLPEENEAVNIVWVNSSPVIYYQAIKDKPQSATGVYYRGQWYWWSAVVQDYLAEYGKWECDKMDDAIEVTHWMPLPELPKEEENHDNQR